MADVLVVGGGLGGLSSAIATAAAGHRVHVLEGAEQLGGKAGTAVVDGVEVDTGPSLLTLPRVFDALFELAGTRLRDEVTLRELEPAFRYQWPDGTALDVSRDLERTLAEVRHVLGDAAARELADFSTYAKSVWEAAWPTFVGGPAPSLRRLATPRRLLGSARAMMAIDPLRTMRGAIERRVRSPHLRDVLSRYATYNGSDARRAPATLNCIAHVDLSLGGLGIEGGVTALVSAMTRVAERLGVRFELGRWVDRIETGRVEAGARTYRADAIVINADVAQLPALLGGSPRPPEPAGPPSTSAWNAIVRARQDPEASGAARRAPHTVLFPERYLDELADLFDRDRPPRDPTVYVCAPAVAHGRSGWPDAEPLFVMINAPPEPEHGARDPAVWTRLEEIVMERLRGVGVIGVGDAIRWRRTPTDLARRFPGSRGALYGAASSSPRAAFQRPANRLADGLYLASGGAHPGGGMPLCVLSGRAAADLLIADLCRRGR